MTARKLVLHVGHGKTGSSMIQSILALSRDGLAEQGIHYPEFPTLEIAKLGRLTSGNLDRMQPKLKTRWTRAISENPEAQTVLFSNEGLMRQHSRIVSDIRSIQSDGVTVKAILFIRDPLDHCVSAYCQGVKRDGDTRTLAEALNDYVIPNILFDYLTAVRSDRMLIEVANYSRHAGELVHTFADMLGAHHAKLVWPPVKTVNRSLSGGELHLMRRLNWKYDTDVTMRVADALCNDLPDIRPGRPYLSPEDHAAFNARMAPMIDKVNALLPESEQYRLTPYEDYAGKGMVKPGDDLTFAPEQIHVIVEHLPGGGRRRDGGRAAVVSALRRLLGR